MGPALRPLLVLLRSLLLQEHSLPQWPLLLLLLLLLHHRLLLWLPCPLRLPHLSLRPQRPLLLCMLCSLLSQPHLWAELLPKQLSLLQWQWPPHHRTQAAVRVV